jgi:hypothetical protein
MTRDDVIRMAREADLWLTSDERIAAVERFAALVAAAKIKQAQQIIDGMKPEIQTMLEKTYIEGAVAGAKAEREACAKVCDDMSVAIGVFCAAAIRARGEA